MLGGMIATNLYAYLSNALRALGDSKTPLYALIAASILNIAFEYFAILVLKLGIAGASGATILAQMISVLFLFGTLEEKFLNFKSVKIYGSWTGQKLLTMLDSGFQWDSNQASLQLALSHCKLP